MPVVPDNDDPLRNTRTTYAGPVVRLLLAPYWVNFYLEHHLFMFVPCWRLPAAHRALPIRRTVLVGAARRSTYETIVVMATAP